MTDRWYNYYVPAPWQCIVAKGPLGTRAFRPMGDDLTVKIIPKTLCYSCFAGPEVIVNDDCYEVCDMDGDWDVDLRDFALATNKGELR